MPQPERGEAEALAGLLPGGGSGFEQLRETRDRVQSVLQVVLGDDGVLVQDFSGRIAYANAPAAQMLGSDSDSALLRMPPAELLGRLWLEDVATGERLQALPGSAVLQGEPVVERTLRVTTASGIERYLTVRALPVHDRAGAVAASITVLRDITEQRRNADFREKVLGIVSHDLRTPLTAISLTAALIRRRTEKFAPWVAEAAGRIQNSAERATRMVRDLLDLTQAQLGRGLPIERRPLEVVSLVEGVIEELLAAHPDRIVDLRHSGEAIARWDPDRMRQVLVNLLGNALTHGPDDTRIEIEISAGADQLHIAIRNQGPPIPAEQLETLFEPFMRGRAAADPQRSLGLGLYIVKEIVETHGGTVEVSSTAAAGTTFTLQLPPS